MFPRICVSVRPAAAFVCLLFARSVCVRVIRLFFFCCFSCFLCATIKFFAAVPTKRREKDRELDPIPSLFALLRRERERKKNQSERQKPSIFAVAVVRFRKIYYDQNLQKIYIISWREHEGNGGLGRNERARNINVC